jgi:2'-5' RNA ligase
MRLFIAINFNTETRTKLFALRDELRGKSESGNFSAPENLHLTLAFIGEVSPKKVDAIKSIMDTVTFVPFAATVARLGTFSSSREVARLRGKRSNDGADELFAVGENERAKSVATWWAGLREDKPFMDLQREIEHKLALCGFEMDGRKYNPHVTLGREVVTGIKPQTIEPFGETVNAIELMKSERIDGKLTYTAIYTRLTRVSL